MGIDTYQFRREMERYSRKVSMEEIESSGYNLNILRYVSTSGDEIQIRIKEVHAKLTAINENIQTSTDKHNEFLK